MRQDGGATAAAAECVRLEGRVLRVLRCCLNVCCLLPRHRNFNGSAEEAAGSRKKVRTLNKGFDAVRNREGSCRDVMSGVPLQHRETYTNQSA